MRAAHLADSEATTREIGRLARGLRVLLGDDLRTLYRREVERRFDAPSRHHPKLQQNQHRRGRESDDVPHALGRCETAAIAAMAEFRCKSANIRITHRITAYKSGVRVTSSARGGTRTSISATALRQVMCPTDG